MSFITCSICGAEYYLQENKYPFKDKGGSVECSCGETLQTWGKGCIDYSLIPAAKMRELQERKEKTSQRAPLCPTCNSKMTLKHGPYSAFWGCSRFPTCNGTKKLRESDRDLL
jgi:ssDNA-binding Zn-finger/Zn-ribbon topoisomerase 1